ncbi:hypothetical protein [Brevibacillus dissolubilis]|uniref:hypothetical protein n=1 Tax=Brevibacillus dissolubilis TaxID=1844116 RepID=UPI00159BC7F1|nr:hypothetical protein [Brevibacillus dissolubilis]
MNLDSTNQDNLTHSQTLKKIPLSSLLYRMEDSLEQKAQELYNRPTGSEFRFLYWE